MIEASTLVDNWIAAAGTLRGPFPVPEWGGEIYAPKWTIARQRAVHKLITADEPDLFARVVYENALNQDGQRLFQGAGTLAAMVNGEDLNLLFRIARWIMSNDETPTIEQAEGN